MNNYLLSIDPSIKNTGFTLWKKTKRISECEVNYNEIEYIDEWKPIWISSYNFNKYEIKTSLELKWKIRDYIIPNIDTKPNNTYPWLEKFDLIIERGTFHSKNGIGYETQEHLRGFIAGQFNKLITKDMLISPSEWKKWYKENYKNIEINYNNWKKEYSLILVKDLITFNNWNITISNHDEADSLLIGWYYLNKENK
ncbi:hypothetical protein [Spiroplasma endosymbiont of Villa modesta]|uniref:hypothetical protein n=1 Tax=Spiroplasma endosymbiont of Villa modesta TaxID=3066293 RepID=UPI00313D7465